MSTFVQCCEACSCTFVQTKLILSGLYSGFGMNTRKEPVRQRLIRGVGSGSKDQIMLSSYLGRGIQLAIINKIIIETGS